MSTASQDRRFKSNSLLRQEVKGDEMLQLLNDEELAKVDEILEKYKHLMDYEGDNPKILKQIEEIPSIAEIVQSICKEKFNKMSEEDKEMLFCNPVGSAKYIEAA